MNINQLMKQAKKMQAKMAELQAELEQKTVESSAGGGMVKVIANGKQEILSITIDPEVVNAEDIEMLQDLILAAVNDALRKAQEMVAEEMGKITGGLKIPGLF
ncbi:MAG TPA: YbaB/EbfC family nucleoid-associated protein [Candidatus Desulfofervidus auxilii]|uniref:Nucleoid-associated protein ENJ03_01605 n=1 Tax=Desulfofervidus auxilii TaxID=1621989 RepID=A0A7V1I3S1_DESA2|nr:YbaB/EbfC family nucleoid-associated protein [Candidatus Desulfofervidus auxilii]